MVFFEIWERLVKIFGVDIGQDLPEDLAILELAPGRDSTRQIECVNLKLRN